MIKKDGKICGIPLMFPENGFEIQKKYFLSWSHISVQEKQLLELEFLKRIYYIPRKYCTKCNYLDRRNKLT